MRRIKTWRDPYGSGFSTCRPKEIELNTGLTVLVGCNGAGKSTLLQNISAELNKIEIPVMFFDNLHDGGHNALERAGCSSNFKLLASLITSSEGENLHTNIGEVIAQVRSFLKEGITEREKRRRNVINALKEVGGEKPDEEEKVSKERWLLFDAADSGYSIDNVIELKDVITLMMSDANKMGLDLYIIISANEYELANGERCFDVNSGKYLTFTDYEDYKRFILKSREKKDKRYAKARCKLFAEKEQC